jgi:hypothetical protein
MQDVVSVLELMINARDETKHGVKVECGMVRLRHIHNDGGDQPLLQSGASRTPCRWQTVGEGLYCSAGKDEIKTSKWWKPISISAFREEKLLLIRSVV